MGFVSDLLSTCYCRSVAHGGAEGGDLRGLDEQGQGVEVIIVAAVLVSWRAWHYRRLATTAPATT